MSLLLTAGSVFGQSIFTIAGGGSDDNRPATVAAVTPLALTFDDEGNLHIADFDHRVRVVSAATGRINTIAGTGSPGFSGDGGPATKAQLDRPFGVAVDSEGNVYVTDSFNSRIRRIDGSSGVITTIAGGGSSSIDEDVGPTEARIDHPIDITFDLEGRLLVSDRDDSFGRILRIDLEAGSIERIAGGGTIVDSDGLPATDAKLANANAGIVVDEAGNIYFSEYDGFEMAAHRVRKIEAETGVISTVAGTGEEGFSGDGGPATQARLYLPVGLSFDPAGNLHIVDYGNRRIRAIDRTSGIIRTVATRESGFLTPRRLKIDDAGNLFFSDLNRNQILMLRPGSPEVEAVAGNGYRAYFGDGGPGTASQLRAPSSLAVDDSGDLILTDRDTCRVRKLSRTSGSITTIAGDRCPADGWPREEDLYFPSAVALDSVGNIYVADEHRVRKIRHDTGEISTIVGGAQEGFAGDGGPASEGRLSYPLDIAASDDGDLYILDSGNWRIRKIDSSNGTISTVAGNGEREQDPPEDGDVATDTGLYRPFGLAIDSDENLYIADSNYLRRVDAMTGRTTSVQTTAVRVVLDHKGRPHVYGYNGVVRRVSADGSMIHIAGNGKREYSGDGGPATAAGIGMRIAWHSLPGIAFDRSGTLFIGAANRIRAVPPCVEIDVSRLVSPSDHSSGVPVSPSLVWKEVKGAFRYDLYLDTSTSPEQLIAADLETTSFTASNLASLTKYYWKVVAKGDQFCEPFRTEESEVWSFTTTTDCGHPEIGTISE